MERKERDSEKVRVAVIAKRNESGYKFSRWLSLAEGNRFLETGLVPAEALSPKTFASAKHMASLPGGSTCMCCGKGIGGETGGWIVKIAKADGPAYTTICDEDYATVVGKASAEVADPEPEPEDDATDETEMAAEEATKLSDTAGVAPDIAAALRTLTTALSEPKAEPVDKAKIIAEAVQAAKDEACKEAQKTLRKSVADFIRDGEVPSESGESAEDEPALARATGDGVKTAHAASNWSAKATPEAMNAVEKLNSFLSEFSYFRNGVSMRLINTFAMAKDKRSALYSYCEVSQMEDLLELNEKMKSPEFKAVCEAFKPFKPEPLNRRFAVFYGAPGGGKTYAAIKAGEKINGGSCDVVPCSPSMDAADMLYAYRLDYKTGKRGYVPTALLTAMVSGRAVVLDEVNLLPMEARMFLQNILDNKSKVHIMGVELPINDGFFVIGTMNIDTGLGSSPLPLPLVDRACVVKEFKTTVEQAAVGAGLC